jgi:hypothetical protein
VTGVAHATSNPRAPAPGPTQNQAARHGAAALSALHEAIDASDARALSALLAAAPRAVNARNAAGFTPLHAAAARAAWAPGPAGPELLSAVLSAPGVDLHARLPEDPSPAPAGGPAPIGGPQAEDVAGFTALMLAAAAGAPPAVAAALLGAGAAISRAELQRVVELRPYGDWAFGRTAVDPRTLALLARAVVESEAASVAAAAAAAAAATARGRSDPPVAAAAAPPQHPLPVPARPGAGVRLDALVGALSLRLAAAERDAACDAALGPAAQQLLLAVARDVRALQAEAAAVAAARAAVAAELGELEALRRQLGLPERPLPPPPPPPLAAAVAAAPPDAGARRPEPQRRQPRRQCGKRSVAEAAPAAAKRERRVCAVGGPAS